MLIDAIGLIGMALILGTYFGLQAGKLDAAELSYSVLNLLGAVLVLISLWFKFNLAAFLLEVAWCGISVYGIVRALRTSNERPAEH